MMDTCSSENEDKANKEFMKAQDKALAEFDDDILTQDILNYFGGKAHIDEDGTIVIDDDYSDNYIDTDFMDKDPFK